MRNERSARVARRERPPRLTMPLEEAERISTNAADGLLDTSDPDVARVVAQANRVVTRSQMWGSTPDLPTRRWRRLTVLGGLLFVLIWVAGLMLPLLASLGK
ncbi:MULTISPECIES: hypothetical protein [unclassified Curtobacterium]|uniref:hypothetical protein n=1 Tax=unclassified Curtobacterium TaxID=257496 RepID=UPI000DA96138|nr:MULTISPECIES: hypothetical protein [unclassified Curtobacterium]PZE25648.1 hypothetical protein DEI86_10120 [Curtobacterium sp. MCBD17_028]PZE78483.1 hypothetical protein DEI82_01615 [Curtobacterium sp. MCBD17_019]PZF57132.1 hypothetical protein DEI92_13260 [Curtobacterium sp. MCBD17_034]PZF63275.1 hypothetical protein DEI81_07615 [Curtobacterium sp. MCBD17_013]PZM33518.1 hypothetical protein DEI90_12540 [Curtobacterium sp. MCBD17_031]